MKNILKNCFVSRIVMLCAIVLGISTFGTSPALAAGHIGEVIGGVGDFEIVPPSIDLEVSDYTITVKPNGATSHTSDIVFQAKAGLSYEDTDGNNITSIPVMTRTGFTLKGYYDAASGGNMVIPATGVLPAVTTFTANTTLYAQWTPVTYIITLNDNGGGSRSGTVKEVYNTKWTNISGTTITSVTKPTRTGYTFNGYYTATTGGTQKIPATGVLPAVTTFTANTTLYAQWTPVTYTITLNDNGGGSGSGTVKEVYNTKWTNSSGTTITSVTKPTRTGYTFKGYYTTATGGTQKIPATGVLPANTTFTADTKLYAQWTANKITVDYNEYGGAAIANGSCNYDGTLTLPTTSPVRDGFTFNGWLMADGTVQKTGSVACNSTKLGVTSGTASNITAQWTLSEVTIIYTIGSNFSKEIKYSPTSTETIPMKFTDGNITYNVTTWTEGSIEGVGDCGAFANFGSGKTVKSLVDAWLEGCGSNKIPLDAYAYTQICPAGTYLNNGICAACAQNSYSAAGASKCTPCPGGKLTSGTGSTTCNKSCTNPNADKVTAWNDATWNQSTNTVTGTCSIKSCQTGYVNQSGSCSLQSYTVQYSCGDATGTAPAKTTVSYGQSFEPAATPGTCIKPGYEFAGWQTTDNSGATVTKPGGTPYAWTYTASKTLTATWKQTCYEIELEYGPVGNLSYAYIYKSANEKDQLYADMGCTIPLTGDYFEEMQSNPADGIPNGSILHFSNSDGDVCLTYGGGSQFDYDESCSVTEDACWYAVYQCAAGYTRNGDTVGSDDECRPECYMVTFVWEEGNNNEMEDYMYIEHGDGSQLYSDSSCSKPYPGMQHQGYIDNAEVIGFFKQDVQTGEYIQCTNADGILIPDACVETDGDNDWYLRYQCDDYYYAPGTGDGDGDVYETGDGSQCQPVCYEIELVPSSDYGDLDLVWAKYGFVTDDNFYDDSACDSRLQGAYVEKDKSNATWLGYTMNGVPSPSLTELPDDYFCTSEESDGMPTGNCFIESDTTWISIYECDEGFRANGKYVDYDTPCTASSYAITLDAGVGTGLNPTKIYAKPGSGWYSDAAAGAGDEITSVTMPYSNKDSLDWLFMGFFTGQNGSGTQVISKNGNIVAPDFMFEGPATVYAYYEKCTCDAGDGVDRCVPTADSEGTTCTYQVTCESGYNKRGSFDTTFTESGDAHVLKTEFSCVSSNAQTGYVCPPDSSYYTSCNEGKYMAVKDASGNYAYNGTPQSGNSCENCPENAAYCPGGTSAPLYSVMLGDDIEESVVVYLYANENGEYYTNEDGSLTNVTLESLTRLNTLPIEYRPQYSGQTFNGYWTQSTGGEQYIDANGNFLKGPSSDINLHAQWSLNCYEIDLDPYDPTIIADRTGVEIYYDYFNVIYGDAQCQNQHDASITIEGPDGPDNSSFIGYTNNKDFTKTPFEYPNMCFDAEAKVDEMFGGCMPTSNETWYPVYRCDTGYTANGVYVDVNGTCSESMYGVGDISYDCDAPTSETAPKTPSSCNSSSECKMPGADACGVYTGYKFAGWEIELNSGKKVIVDADEDVRSLITIAEDNGSWSVTAQWEAECYEIELEYSEYDGSVQYARYYMRYNDYSTFYPNSSCSPGQEIWIDQDHTGWVKDSIFYGFINVDGDVCFNKDGSLTGDCSVTEDTTWVARYKCKDGYTGNGQYVNAGEKCLADCYEVEIAYSNGTGTELYAYYYIRPDEWDKLYEDNCYTGTLITKPDDFVLKSVNNATLQGFYGYSEEKDENVLCMNADGTLTGDCKGDIINSSSWLGQYSCDTGYTANGTLVWSDGVCQPECYEIELEYGEAQEYYRYIYKSAAEKDQLYADAECKEPLTTEHFANMDPNPADGIQNGDLLGFRDSETGKLCLINGAGGQFNYDESCSVTSDYTSWSARYQCNVGYTGNGDTVDSDDGFGCHPSVYTVDFDANGGAGEMPGQPFTYDVAQNLTPNIFTRTGYTFGGWNTASDGSGTDYDDKALISNLLEDITLYAQWELNTYTITYNLDGGENSDSNPSSYTVEDTVVLQPAEKTGFRFVGWFDDAGNQITQIAKGTTGEINLNAQWSETAYVITYENMTGAVNNPNNKLGYNVTTETFDLYAPTKTGYDFGGWYDNENLTGTAVTQIETGSTGDKTFWAKWTATVYTCNSGEYLNVTECTLCPEGAKCPTTQFTYNAEVQGLIACAAASEYQDQTGQIVCKTVNNGYVANDEHTEQTECGENYWCKGGIRTQCIGDGVTGTTTASDATQCHLNAVACSDAGGRGTQDCDYNPNTGKYDDCEPCDFSMCNDGYYKNDTTCVICPVGSWCANNQQNACPEGYLTTTTGVSAQTQCFVKCQNKEVEYGMAFADNAQEFWPSVCTYTKGTSATGNPCDIINNVCVETSCNYNYEMKGSKCVECVRDNALSFKKGSDNCVVDSCEVGYYPYGKQCMAATRECTPTANAVSAQQAWNTKTNSYDICVITQCADGYHLTDNRCVANEQTCVLAHGTGVQTWNVSLNRWNDCTATSCNPGYTNDPYLTDDDTWEQCGRCNNMFDDKNQIAVSSYSRECEIAACLYQGQKYILENNECRSICDEKIDETGHRYFKNGKCMHDCESGYMEW